MAKKKKGLNIGGVNFDFHFNNPALQQAYQKWFVDMPLRAPVEIEYYDPTVTSTGAVKRSPITTTMDPYEQARGQMMEKYKYGYNSGDAAVFKQHPIVKRKKDTSSGSQATALGATTKQGSRYVGDRGAALALGTARTNERLKALGVTPVGQSSHDSFWNRTLDVLSRGNYAVAEATHRAFEEGRKPGSSMLDLGDYGKAFEAAGEGFWQGLSGKKKTTFTKMAAEGDLAGKITAGLNRISGGNQGFSGNANEKAGHFYAGALGLGADIGLDPTTYTGVGLVGKGGKAAKLAERAAEHLDEAGKILGGSRAAAKLGKTQKTVHTFDDIEKELLSGKRYVSGKVKHSEQAQIYEPLRNMRNRIHKARTAEIRAELRTTEKYADMFDRGGMRNATSLAAANKALGKEASELATKEADEWLATAIKNYEDTVKTAVTKGLGIGAAGPNGKKITVVPAPVLNAVAGRVKNIDVVDRGLKAADRYLRASAGVGQELHNLRLQATNAGMTRAEFQGNRLRAAFSGTHRDLRENSWEQALNRHSSGETIRVEGKDLDAGEFLNSEIDVLEHHTTGTISGNTPMSAKELNNFLPPGFRGKFLNGGKGVADVRKSMKNWDLKDGPRALFVAQQAYERANAMRSMYVSAADAFGIRTAGQGALKNAGNIFNDLKGKGWREVSQSKTHGLLKDVIFDEETAKGLEKMVDLINSERNWNGFLRKLARITGPIKFLLTVPNPGYHIRNSIGDAFINELDNVGLRSYMQSAQVLRRATEKYGGTQPLIMEEGNILENAFKKPSQTVLFHTSRPLRKPGGTSSSAVTEAEIYAGMNKFGITQNFTLSEFGNLVDNPNIVNQFGGKTKSWMVNKSELRENYFRLAHFIDLVKRNPTGARTLEENMAAAAARIRKTHFDYTDFTKFEKQVASNIIPFYKWTRKAIPLMLEVMFTNPGKAIIPNKAQEALSVMLGQDPYDEDPFPQLQGMIPEWMIQAGYVPFGKLPGRDAPSMGGIASPFTDTFTQTLQPALQAASSGNPKQMFNFFAQQSNPALKVPYELVQNENTFLSKDQPVPVYREDTKKKDLFNYGASQLPYVRQLLRAFGGPADKRNFGALVSQLSGIYTQELTPSMARGELYRQNTESADRLRKAKDQITKKLEDKGVTPPQTESEWEDLFEALSQANGGDYHRPSRKRTFSVL